MAKFKDVKTPECEKLRELRPLISKLSEFIEWLAAGEYNADIGPIELAYYPPITSEPVYKKTKRGDVLFPEVDHYRDLPREEWQRETKLASLTYQTETLLYKFLGIDHKKLEDERRALLDAQREANDDADAPKKKSSVSPQ